MDALLELSKVAAKKILSINSVIQVVSHYDADGISSAAIITSSLSKINKKFELTIVKRINSQLIKNIKEKKPELVIFTDLGSSYLEDIEDLECDIIIADHHEITYSWVSDKLIHINPELFGIEGLSGAGVTHILAKGIAEATGIKSIDSDAAPLAIVGTIGDFSSSDSESFNGNSDIEKRVGLKLFGRFTRPLHRSLAMSDIPGIDNESKAIQFLSEIGINIKEDERWRTLSDLDETEKQRLTDAIVYEYLKNGKEFKADDVFDNIWTLKKFPDELQDAKEFATLLNCCGRMNESETGLALCLGSTEALENARKLMKGYRRLISNSIRWVENNPENIRTTKNAIYIFAGNNIPETIIGTVASIYFRSLNEKKPVIGFAASEDGVKVSARSTSNININKIVVKAADECNGSGGGHCEAAGCNIEEGCENKFMELCNKLFEDLNAF